MSGPLTNEKHERFCQALIAGETLAQAYVTAGYRPNEKNAARLKKNEGVAARLAELKAEVAAEVVKSTVIDAQWVLDRACELYEKALAEKQYSVAKGTVELIGKHIAVQAFRDQVNHSGLIEYKNLSDEEIAARIAAHEAARGQRPTTH